MTLRSGTNSLRGSAIVLHRGTWLDSNQIQNIRNNISNEGHTYYNGETMLSGPIRRGKTFFMGGYQGFYENIPFPVTRTIPTDLQLQGDFSQTFTANGTARSSSTTRRRRGRTAPDGIHPRSVSRQQDRPNVICVGHPISQDAAAVLSPAERHAEQPVGSGQFRQLAERRTVPLQLVSDAHRPQLFSDRHRLSFSNSGNWGIEFRNENGLPEPSIRSDNYPTHRNHYLLTVDDNVTINSSTLWSTRVVVGPVRRAPRQGLRQHRSAAAVPGALSVDRTAVRPDQRPGRRPDDVPAHVQAAEERRLLAAQLGLEGGGQPLHEGGRRNPRVPVLPAGRSHLERDVRLQRHVHAARSAERRGRDVGQRRWPRSCSGCRRAAASRPAYARTEQYRYFALLRSGRLEDRSARDAEHRPALGLSAAGHRAGRPHGLWFRRRRRRIRSRRSSLRARSIRPPGSQLSSTGGLLFANRGGPTSPYRRDWNNIQPRVGFSYKLNGLADRAQQLRPLVPRAVERRPGRRLPHRLSTHHAVPGAGAEQRRSRHAVVDAVPRRLPGTARRRAGPANRHRHGLHDSESATSRFPYTDQWMAGVDVQLPWNIGLDVAYVGNKVSKLGVSRPINEVPKSENDKRIPSMGGNGELPQRDVPESVRRAGAGPDAERGHRSRGDLLRPYTQFGGITMNRLNLGSAYYNALETVGDQALLERRDVRGQLHLDEARGSGQLLHQLRHRAVPGSSRETSGGIGSRSRRSSICPSDPESRSAANTSGLSRT